MSKAYFKYCCRCYFVALIFKEAFVMNRCGFVLFATLFAVSGQVAAADLKLASWNLGWHLNQAEAKSWIAGCNTRYELDQNKTWIKSKNTDAKTGWEMDWRPRDAGIKLPWNIESMPPCNVYEDDTGKVIAVTKAAFKNRSTALAETIAQISPDVIAFQEVSGERAIKEVLGKSASNYQICSYSGYSVQRLAFAWKKSLAKSKGVCEKYDALSLPENNNQRRPRPGLRLALDINGKKTAFLNVHLKSSCVSPLEKNEQQRGQLESTQKDCLVLQQQIRPLENWIETTSTTFDRFIVMGDFNRDLWHEYDQAKTLSARIDASAPTAPRDAKTRVRLLLSEVNDNMPMQSAMTLASASCKKSDSTNALCTKAKLLRLSSDEMKSLGDEMGCRNPVALDQMLISNSWNAGTAVSNAEKIAIAPGSSSINTDNKGVKTVTLSLSDHCPTQITLPN